MFPGEVQDHTRPLLSPLAAKWRKALQGMSSAGSTHLLVFLMGWLSVPSHARESYPIGTFLLSSMWGRPHVRLVAGDAVSGPLTAPRRKVPLKKCRFCSLGIVGEGQTTEHIKY